MTPSLSSAASDIVAKIDAPLNEQKRYRRWASRQLRKGLSPSVVHSMLYQLVQAQKEGDQSRFLRDDFRFSTRIFEKFPSQRIFDELVSAMNSSETESARELMNAVFWNESDRESKQMDECVVGASIVEALKAFANHLKQLFGMRFAPPIRFLPDISDKASEIVAFTDGSSMTFSARIGIATRAHANGDASIARWLNFAMYLYLVTHEQAHLGLGSFDLNFRTKKGKQLLELLGQSRRELAAAKLKKLSSILFQELELGDWVEYQRKPKKRTRLADLFVHFEDPKLASFLYNVLEDMRIEHWIKLNLNGLYEVHRLVDAIRHEAFGTPPQLNSTYENFFNGILQYATGLIGNAHITEHLKEPFETICQIIDRQSQKESSDAYDSAMALVLIMDVLDHTFSKNERQVISTSKALHQHVSNWEIAIRRFEEIQLANASDFAGGNEDIEPLESNGTGELYPELTPNGLIPNAVRVITKSFRAPTSVETEAVTELDLPLVWRSIHRNTIQKKGRRRWNSGGQEFDEDQLPDYVAARRAGSEINIHYDNVYQSSTVEIHVLLDGSVSMETHRRSLAGRSSFHRAKQIAKLLAKASEATGIPFQAYVGVDAGRHEVHYCKIATENLGNTHPISFGGFRIGALIRHVLSHPRSAGVRRVVAVLTDAAPAYYLHKEDNRSMVETLQNHSCFSCAVRSRCVNEIAVPIIGSETLGERSIWQPTHYQWADVRHAIDTYYPKDMTQIIMLNDDLDESVWNATLSNHWANGMNDSGLAEAMTRLSKFMDGTA